VEELLSNAPIYIELFNRVLSRKILGNITKLVLTRDDRLILDINNNLFSANKNPNDLDKLILEVASHPKNFFKFRSLYRKEIIRYLPLSTKDKLLKFWNKSYFESKGVLLISSSYLSEDIVTYSSLDLAKELNEFLFNNNLKLYDLTHTPFIKRLQSFYIEYDLSNYYF